MPALVEYVLYSLYAITLIETLYLVVVFSSPAATFANAKLFGKHVVMQKIFGSKQVKFITVIRKNKSLRLRGMRHFVRPKTGLLTEKGKLPFWIAPIRQSVTEDLDFFAWLDVLEEKTETPIETIKDYRKALKSLSTEDKKKIVKIPAYNTIYLRDIDKLFDRNLDAELYESDLQEAVRKASKFSQMNPAIIVLLVVLLIGGSIAYTIVNQETPSTAAVTCLVETINNTVQTGTVQVVGN